MGIGLSGLVGFGGVVGFTVGEMVGVGSMAGRSVGVRFGEGFETVSSSSGPGVQADTRETIMNVMAKSMLQDFISSLVFCRSCIHGRFLVVYSGTEMEVVIAIARYD